MIYGETIRLRAIERSDLPTFVRWLNDPEVRRYLLMYEPLSLAAEEQWFERRLGLDNDFLFGIEARVGEAWVHIGNTGLHRVDWKNRSTTFGIMIGEPAYWGRGYGSDATRTIVGYAFEELNLNRVELDVFHFNPRAIRAYEKVGFRHEGTRRAAMFREGDYHDVLVMGILAGEWFADRARDAMAAADDQAEPAGAAGGHSDRT